MNFKFSKHALEKIQLRKIPIQIAESIINKPQQIIEDDRDKKVYQSIIEFEEKKIVSYVRLYCDK